MDDLSCWHGVELATSCGAFGDNDECDVHAVSNILDVNDRKKS